MTTDPHQPDIEPADSLPEVAGQLWILLVWHPALGLPVDPVAVLGLNEENGPGARIVRWVPLVYDPADPWRERLGESTTTEDVERWIAQSGGACAIEPAAVPEGATDLAHAADLVLNELLAEVLPALPQRGDA
ncbi:hypothetical protein ABZ896_22930 [Streptomyces sp. NPDC047072]|uniref:hypothetical protein n=1 Tax=Streptomyces sp. NPDC047072 TaxID=3154809 RepID=UPI0033C71F2C